MVKEEIIKNIYENVNNSACYSSASKLLRECKRKDKSITKKDVDLFLKKSLSYTLHKQPRYKFERLSIKPAGLFTDWQADLAVMDKIIESNDGYRYILVCIDCLSRKIYATPVKTKSSNDMKIAFDRIFSESKYIPWRIITDSGVEFVARAMQAYFKSKDIIKHETYSHPTCHAGMVERGIRTLKNKLYRYFTEKQTHRWVDILPKIVNSINNSVCRSTGYTPNSFNFENASERRKNMYNIKKDHTSILSVGEKVRVIKTKTAFKKGYLPTFSDEIFTIHNVLKTNPTTYKIVSDEGIIQNGKFYRPELCPVIQDSDTIYRIIVLKERQTKKGREYFVSWVGYDDSHNSWISASDIVNNENS